MEAKAQTRHLRVTPQKARRVVSLIRGRQALDALDVLKFAPQGASEPVYKIVASAIANSRFLADKHGERFDPAELIITNAYVDEGPTMKRFRPRAKGAANRIKKRTCHITVEVATRDDIKAKAAKKETIS